MSFRTVSAAFILGLLGCSSAASALTLNVTSAGVYRYDTARIYGNIAGFGAFDRNEISGVLVLNGTTSAGKPFSVVSYCFDLLHNISVGLNAQANVNYTLSVEAITTDQIGGPGIGNTLTPAQISKMARLATFGARRFISGSGDLSNQMPALQAAIWNVEYGLSATLANPTQQALYNRYVSTPFGNFRPAYGLVSKDANGQIIGAVQGQIVGSGVPGVPEPQSWAMLVMGFGLLGVTSRLRRRKATLVRI